MVKIILQYVQISTQLEHPRILTITPHRGEGISGLLLALGLLPNTQINHNEHILIFQEMKRSMGIKIYHKYTNILK